MRRFIVLWLMLLPHTLAVGEPDQLLDRRGYEEPPPAWGPPSPNITLKAGEQHLLLISAHAALRLLPTDAPLDPTDVALWGEDGNGLARPLPWQVMADGGLVATPAAAQPLLLHLQRPASATAAISVQLTTAQLEATSPPPLYRQPLQLSLPEVMLTPATTRNQQRFFQLAAGELTTIELEGPCRLRLESRAIWPNDEGELGLFLRQTVQIDGDTPQQWDSYPIWESRPVAIEPATHPWVVGMRESRYLDIPSGSHQLSLRANQGLLIRPLLRCDTDLLLPSLNGQPHPAGTHLAPFETVPRREPHDQRHSVEWTVEQAVEQATAMATDPALPEGALQAAGLLRAMAPEGNPMGDALHATARTLEARWTSYLDLLPTTMAGLATTYAYFLQQHLIAPDQPTSPIALPPQLLNAALQRLPAAHFVALPGGGEVTFLLPERQASSRLRLVVERSGEAEPTLLEIEVEGEQPQTLQLFPLQHPPLQSDYLQPGIAAQALQMLSQQDPSVDRAPTQGALFSTYLQPAPTLQAGTMEIPLPPSADRVVVRTPPGSQALQLALQLRVEPAALIRESEFMAAIEQLGGDETLWYRFQHHEPLEGLLALWIAPLQRWLKQQGENFVADVVPLPTSHPDPANAKRQATIARQAGLQHDWLQALAAWRNVVASSLEPRLISEAWQGIWHTLQQLEEPALRERLLKGVLLYPTDEGVRHAARQALEADYRRYGQSGALLSLLAWEITQQQPTTEQLNRLAAALNEAEHYRLALTVALLPPTRHRELPLVAELALRLEWQQTLTTTLDTMRQRQQQLVADPSDWLSLLNETFTQLSEQDTQRTLGWAAWQRGDRTQAQQHWKKAGSAGQAIMAARQQGEQLSWGQGDQTTLTDWWTTHPGPQQWVTPTNIISNSAGHFDYSVATSGQRLRMYATQPNQPLVLTIEGPTQVRVEIRPQHQTTGVDRINGWAEIRQAETTDHLMIHENLSSQGLLSSRKGQPLPGTALIREFHLPAGTHQLRVGSETLPLFVRAQLRQPLLPLAAPPRPMPLQADTRPYPHPNPLPSVEGLEQLVWQMEHHPLHRAAIAVEAEALFEQLPVTPQSAILIQRLRRYNGWQPVTTIDSSAGVRWLSQTSSLPASPTAALRVALLAPGSQQSRLISGWRRMLIVTQRPPGQQTELQLEWLTTPFTPLESTTVAVTINQEQSHTLTLDRDHPQLRLPLPPGVTPQTVEIELRDPVVAHFLRIGLIDPAGKPVNWQLRHQDKQLYQLATQAEPLVIDIEGPMRLRIDEWQQPTTRSRYQVVPAGWQTLQLRPSKGESVAYLRVFQRQLLEAPLPQARFAAATLDLPPVSPVQQPKVAVPQPITNVAHSLNHHATHSYDLRYVVRQDGDEEPGLHGVDRFTQLSLSVRTHSQQRQQHHYAQWGLLGRARSGGTPTLGAWMERRNISPLRLLDWNYGLYGYLQDIEATGWQGTATLRGALVHQQQISPYSSNNLTLAGVAHLMSLKERQADNESQIDNDLFSDYRYDHRWGLTLADTLHYRPWLDSDLSLRLGLSTNEDLNLFQPEQLFARARWDQLLGVGRMSLRYNWQRYLSDDDRQQSLPRYGPELRLSWDLWTQRRHRLELTGQLRHQQDSGESVGLIAISWHRHDQQLTHFAPDEERFKALRQWGWPTHLSDQDSHRE